MRLSDRTTGLFLVGLGGLSAYGGSRLDPIPGQQIGPDVFPLVVGIGLVVCGAMITAGVGRSFEDEAEAAVNDGGEAATHIGFVAGGRALLPPALLLFYVMAVDRLGFVPTAMLIVFAITLALGSKLRLAIPLALLTPFVVHLVFAKLLRVPLPGGLLPMPW